jgi:hypothetical protein
VGAWLSFTSSGKGDGRSFSWEATAGPGPLLRVHDRFADGVGFMDVRVRPPFERLPALKLLHVENEDTARSGARPGRTGGAVDARVRSLPSRGVAWRADSDEVIVARWDVLPTRAGAAHHASTATGPCGRGGRSAGATAGRAIMPFGADAHAERTVRRPHDPEPADRRLGTRHERVGPFFRCEVTTLELSGERRS